MTQELKQVIDELNKQGVKKLSNALKGGNETISIQGNGTLNNLNTNWNNKSSIEFLGNVPATWSTLSKQIDSNVIRTTNTDISNLGIRYILTGETSYKLDFSFFDSSNDSSLNKNNKMSIMAINTILSKEVSHNGQNNNKTLYKYLEDNLSTNPITSVPSNVNYRRQSAEEILITIFKYAGIQISTPAPSPAGDTSFQISYAKNYVPGIGTPGSTVYRPMVKWSDAWKRGPFYGIFVYPIANIASRIVNGMGDMNGWEMVLTILIVVWFTRLLTFVLSFKSVIQQTKMQELAGKKAVIDAKYAAYKGNKQMEMRKNQEVQDLYKKEGVSMFGSIGSIFLTMPFFLAMWRVIGAIPHLKAGVWLGISFPATSWRELFAGQFQYLPLIIAAAFFAGAQQIVPRLLTKKRDRSRINVQQKAAMKKNNKTQNIMLAVFVVMAVIFNAGLQIYWVAGGIWMIGQSIATHKYFVWQSKRKRKLKIKA